MKFKEFEFFEELKKTLEEKVKDISLLIENDSFADLNGVLSDITLLSDMCSILQVQDNEIQYCKKSVTVESF